MKMIEKGDHIEAAPLLVDDDENNPQERMTLRSIFTMFKYYRFETPWFRCGGIGVLLLVQTILLGLTITTTLLWAHYTQQRRDLVYCKTVQPYLNVSFILIEERHSTCAGTGPILQTALRCRTSRRERIHRRSDSGKRCCVARSLTKSVITSAQRPQLS